MYDLPLKISDIHTYSSVNKNKDLSNFLFKQGFKSIAERLKNNSFIKTNILEEKKEKNLLKNTI